MNYRTFHYIFLVLLFTATYLFGLADVKNKATTSYQEDAYNVYWYGKIAFSATDSTNNIWTKALWIGDSNLDVEDGVIQMWGNAASGIDVNAYLEGSGSVYDASFSSFVTDTKLDALGSATPVLTGLQRSFIGGSGTLADSTALNLSSDCEFLRLKFDGQAGNPATAVIYFVVTIPKKPASQYGGPIVVKTNRLNPTTATLPAYGKVGHLNSARD